MTKALCLAGSASKVLKKMFMLLKTMPVDKFGRTDTTNTTRVISGGITMSQANNAFLRRDGGNAATADINLDSHKLINVADPANNKDAANKEYVDINSGSNKVSKSGDTMTGDLAMDGHRVTGLPSGLPRSSSDAINWLQVQNLLRDAVTNNGTVPAGPLYLVNKRYVDEQDTLRVLKDGDTMTGNLLLNVGDEPLRILGCRDLSDSKGFSIILGSVMNQIHCQLNIPITLQTTDGFLCRHEGNDVVRFGKGYGDNRIDVLQDLVMNQHYIVDLHDPRSPQEAATKNYVDNTPKKNFVGYIPPLEANVSCTGFIASGSSATNKFFAFGAFNNQNASWITATDTITGWLQIQCPDPVKIWRVALKARNMANRNITAWHLSASNDARTFTTLLTSTTILEGAANAPSFFNITVNESYQWYRFNITASAGSTDVGVQLMQLNVYDV